MIGGPLLYLPFPGFVGCGFWCIVDGLETMAARFPFPSTLYILKNPKFLYEHVVDVYSLTFSGRNFAF